MAITINPSSAFHEKRKIRRSKPLLRRENIISAIKMLLPVLLVFVGYATIAFIENNNNRIIQQGTKISRESQEFNREIENLKLQIEKAQGRNIITQMKKFRIALNYPKSGQRRKLTKTEQKMVASKSNKKNIAMSKR